MNEKDLLQNLTDKVAKKITNKVIKFLQKDRTNFAGDDSGLKNVWDQICVQKQDEESIYWDAFEDHITMVTSGFVDTLDQAELHLLNRETNAFLDWSFENPESTESFPIDKYEITKDLVDRHIISAAYDWSNARIRAYLFTDSDDSDDYQYRYFM